jgi:hypothetical protein
MTFRVSTLNLENEVIARRQADFRHRWLHMIDIVQPILFQPCHVKILLVTDSALDFGDGGFGLSTMLEVLGTPPGPYVRFELTVGHRSAFASNTQVAVGHPNVSHSIKGVRFDDPNHFTPTMYDEVWLFGFQSSFPTNAEPGPNDWTNMPTQAELRALSEFMDGGGGVFATGDHGGIGSALCGHIPRVRTMRHWFATTGPHNNPAAPDMNSPARNDTNRPGANGIFEFNDQSDDVPQTIFPHFYSRKISAWRRARWPHPLLCGPNGPITVLPDHPHEGQCATPYETGRSFLFDGYGITEYPHALNGLGQPLPEVIARASVLPGNQHPGKQLTFAQTFGVISTYDGDQAGVGRVASDATWHHFVNVNLVGIPGSANPLWQDGFLGSAQGQAHFEQIKAYFRNIAVWLARSSQRLCMRRHVTWLLLWDYRLLEAVTAGVPIRLSEVNITTVLMVGRHARDAMGKFAGQCQTEYWVLELIKPLIPKRIFDILDPWPVPLFEHEQILPLPEPDPVPWFDPEPLLDIALGGAIIALREAFPDPDPEQRDRALEAFETIALEGAARAITQSLESLDIARKGIDELREQRGLDSTRITEDDAAEE